MYLEKEKELKNLISIYRPDQQDAVLIGMATAMLTNEQADTMISYLEKWIGEKNA
jgi:basic membrane lipoprotein Med (substrate-binding protein (PBP1-ABC) superfamily)